MTYTLTITEDERLHIANALEALNPDSEVADEARFDLLVRVENLPNE